MPGATEPAELYPYCPHCRSVGPHKIVSSSRVNEIWRCGDCGEKFTVEIANIGHAGGSGALDGRDPLQS